MIDDIKEVRGEVKRQTFGYILTALGLVAGLAWNDAISALIKAVFPLGGALTAKFIYAIIITIAVVLISKAVLKISDK